MTPVEHGDGVRTAVIVLVACAILLGVVATGPAAAQPDEGATRPGVQLAQATPTPAPAPTAQPLGTNPVLVILDASGSMNADDGTGRPKIDAAKEALNFLIDGLGEEAIVGLRAYGHRTPNTDREAGCQDTELLVPVEAGRVDDLRAAVQGLDASGYTPIGTSLTAAVGDLPPDQLRTVVLISDGIDTCAPPRACDVARQIIADGIQLRVETIGFQVDAAAEAELRCIAEATGGTYRPADDAEDLARELRANVATGTPITGGPAPAEAVTIGPGQYVDTLAYPAERWYAIDLQPGDRVRATASVIGPFDLPQLPEVEVTMRLAFADVIGVNDCAVDQATGIGPFTTALAVDGLEVGDNTVCADPGRYVVGLAIAPGTDDEEDVLLVTEVPVEVFVAVTSAEVAVEAEPVVDRPEIPPPPPVDPGRLPTPASSYLLAVVGFAVVGGIAGTLISRRMGP